MNRLYHAAWATALALGLMSCAEVSPMGPAGDDDAAGDDDDTADDPTPQELLIVTVPALYAAAEDYAGYRETTGFDVEVVTTENLISADATLSEAIASHVASFATREPTDVARAVLLIGDADIEAPDDPAFIPIPEGDGAFGDSAYTDLDGDGVPDLGVGRLPFSEPAAVVHYLAAIQAYEDEPHLGSANREVRLFGGESGFGDAVDQAIEILASSIVDDLSYDFDLEITYQLPSSPLYLPGDAWYDEFAAGYREGALFQPYIGHTLGWLPVEDLADATRPPLLAFLSCSDGAFQYPADLSLAEEVLAAPSPPLAVIAASQVSQPCGNAILAREIGSVVLNDRAATTGDLMVAAMSQVRYREDDLRALIEGFCDAFSEESMDDVIGSHVAMYSLLGDPTVRTHVPAGTVSFDVGLALAAGTSETIAGQIWLGPDQTTPMDLGDVVVTLETDRVTYLGELEDTSGGDLDAFVHNHATGNDHLIAHVSGPVDDGAFEVVLDVPLDAEQGDTYLKAYAVSADGDAIGSQRIGIGG